MAFASPRLRTAVALLLLCSGPVIACSAGDNDDASGTDTPLTAGDTTAPATGPTSTGATTTTGEPATGTGEPPPTTSGDPTSGTSTTTGDSTTGEITSDTGSSDDTGPICDPGQPNCVCDGDACVDGYTCEAGLCVPALMQCDADVESPGESEDTPVELGDITDDDDEFFDEVGILSGATDVDWFHYHGADTLGYYAEPTVTLVAGTQRTCQFLVCEDGVALTTVECPAGTDFAISPKLKPGCCGAASFVIKDFGCPGNDDSVDIWLRVDKAPEDTCYDYNVRLHF